MAKDTSYMRTPEYREKIRQGNLRRYALHPMSEETKRKISLGNSGKVRSPEHCLHISQALMGKPSPLKGVLHFKHTEESKKRISIGHIKFWAEHPEKKKNIGSKTKEVRRIQKWSGVSTAGANKRGSKTKEVRRIQKWSGISTTRSQTYSKLWRDKDYISMMLKARNVKPNKQEMKLEAILQGICPNQFRYNGDFRLGVVLNRYIPDFVNVNGKKQVIELFGTYWHEQEGRGEEERISRYKELGWDCLVVWDYELKDISALTDKIRAFMEVR